MFVLASSSASAWVVEFVSGNSVTLRGTGSPLKEGKKYLARDPEGKARAVLRVAQISPENVICDLVKGKVRRGQTLTLTLRGQAGGTESSDESVQRGGNFFGLPYRQIYVGGLAGYGMQSMNVQVGRSGGSTSSAAMTGSGVTAHLLTDVSILPEFWLRGQVGVQTLKVAATSTFCGSLENQQCQVSMTSISAELWGRYVFLPGDWNPWIGAGLNTLVPIAKEATALKLESITTTINFHFGAGVDYAIGPRLRIPVQVEYTMYLPNNRFSSSAYLVRGGLAYALDL